MHPALPDTPYVLGIAGSPRRHGNSERLLEACLEGVESAGVSARTLAVVEYGPNICRGCNACSVTGECVLIDRMREVYGLIDGAAAIVVASPVYFATVPAALKTLYDRLQPYWARRYVLKQELPPRRPGAILLVRGGGDPFGFTAAQMSTESVFAVLGIDVIGRVSVDDVDSPSDLGRHPDDIAEAHRIGERLAHAVLTPGL